jgi:peptidoglycan/LPS O-acetylase OafA/YrhL
MTATPPSRPSTGYRADIDGLRAIAVLSVVLFHARVAPFSGGYVGVDIFFVISGFLITRLIADDIEQRRFSIVHFYERRIRRIFPALYLVVLICFIPALWLLMPLDLKRFGEAAAATTVFLSNVLFWHRSGYFGESATVQPLLHTWSLAVEEQFYVVYPLFLIVVMRLMRGHGRRLLLIAGLLVASLIASVVITRYWPSAGFYLPASRAWELLLGAMLALRPPAPIHNRAMRELIAGGGLAAILAAIFLFSPETAFPGYAALLPCLGAAALIYAGTSGRSVATSLLGAPACRFVGLISYSFYLWHWPLIVFTQYWYDQRAPAWAVALAVLASAGLGALSWRWIEHPFRQKQTFPRRRIFMLAAVVSAFVFILGAGVSYLQGLPGRFDAATLTYAAGERTFHRITCTAWPPRHGAPVWTSCAAWELTRRRRPRLSCGATPMPKLCAAPFRMPPPRSDAPAFSRDVRAVRRCLRSPAPIRCWSANRSAAP